MPAQARTVPSPPSRSTRLCRSLCAAQGLHVRQLTPDGSSVEFTPAFLCAEQVGGAAVAWRPAPPAPEQPASLLRLPSNTACFSCPALPPRLQVQALWRDLREVSGGAMLAYRRLERALMRRRLEAAAAMIAGGGGGASRGPQAGSGAQVRWW